MAKRALPFFSVCSVIFAAAGISYFSGYISDIIKIKFHKTRINSLEIKNIIGFLVLVCIIISFIPETLGSVNAVPQMEDSVYLTAARIKENSDRNAIVTTFFDEGDFYRAFADRNVTLRGYPDSRKMYLLSRALSTDDENLSAGIFRILNCGESRNEVIQINISLAVKENNCTPSENFLVLSSWIKSYINTVLYYGNWNFSSMSSNLDTKLLYVDDFRNCSVNSKTIDCSEYSVSLENGEATYKGRPVSVIFPSKSGLVFKDRKTAYTMVLYTVGSDYESVAIKNEMLGAVFVRLYFLNGEGLSHFEKFSDIISTKRTLAYRIKW